MKRWVFSNRLPAASQVGHTVFDPSQSTTFEPLANTTWDIRYAGNDSATGRVGRDLISIDGFTVAREALEIAEVVSDGIVTEHWDGVLGLAFSPTNRCRLIC